MPVRDASLFAAHSGFISHVSHGVLGFDLFGSTPLVEHPRLPKISLRRAALSLCSGLWEPLVMACLQKGRVMSPPRTSLNVALLCSCSERGGGGVEAISALIAYPEVLRRVLMIYRGSRAGSSREPKPKAGPSLAAPVRSLRPGGTHFSAELCDHFTTLFSSTGFVGSLTYFDMDCIPYVCSIFATAFQIFRSLLIFRNARPVQARAFGQFSSCGFPQIFQGDPLRFPTPGSSEARFYGRIRLLDSQGLYPSQGRSSLQSLFREVVHSTQTFPPFPQLPLAPPKVDPA